MAGAIRRAFSKRQITNPIHVACDAAHRDSVVFVLTTSSAELDMKAAYAANVAGYVEKATIGADFSGLLDLLERYLEVVNFP